MSAEQTELREIRYDLVWTDDLAKKVFSVSEPRRLKPQTHALRTWLVAAVIALVVFGGGFLYGALVERPGATAGFMLGSAVMVLLMNSVLGRLSRGEVLARHRHLAADGTEETITLSPSRVKIRSRKGESTLSWSAFPCITIKDWGVILWTDFGGRVPLPTDAQTDRLDHDALTALIEKWSASR